MPLLFRKRLIAVRRELTYGTNSLITPANITANAVLVRNLDITPTDIQYASRELVRPFLGNFDDIPQAASVRVSFEVEMQGSGVAGTRPAYGDLLMACGMSETITAPVVGPPAVAGKVAYAPVSNMFDSVSMYFNIDGNVHQVTGARGTVSGTIDAKAIPVWRFELVGIKGPIVSGVLPSVAYAGYKEPSPVNPLFTAVGPLNGFQAIVKMFSFDVANELSFRTLISTEDVQLVDRKPVGSISIEAPAIAMKNYFEFAEKSQAGSFAITQGNMAGLRVRQSFPEMLIKNPRYSEMDGIAMLDMDLMFLPDSQLNGNDEFLIEFT